MTDVLTIGELARRAGVTTVTLRYYDELGLVRPVERVSGQRRYSADAVAEVGVVRLLQEVGFTLAEVQLLGGGSGDPSGARQLAVAKADALRRHLARTTTALEMIEHALVCPEDDFRRCPTFRATVEGLLGGADLEAAHREADQLDPDRRQR